MRLVKGRSVVRRLHFGVRVGDWEAARPPKGRGAHPLPVHLGRGDRRLEPFGVTGWQLLLRYKLWTFQQNHKHLHRVWQCASVCDPWMSSSMLLPHSRVKYNFDNLTNLCILDRFNFGVWSPSGNENDARLTSRDLKASAIYVVTYHNLLEYYGCHEDRTKDPQAIVLSGGLAGQPPSWLGWLVITFINFLFVKKLTSW